MNSQPPAKIGIAIMLLHNSNRDVPIIEMMDRLKLDTKQLKAILEELSKDSDFEFRSNSKHEPVIRYKPNKQANFKKIATVFEDRLRKQNEEEERYYHES